MGIVISKMANFTTTITNILNNSYICDVIKIKMRVTIIQCDIEWAAPQANQQRLDRALDVAPKSDLYVLPEMFSTGFCTEPVGVAEPEDGPSLRWMQRKAAALDAAIAGSVAVEQQGKYYNRFYFVRPSGEVSHYDKHHLFTYGGEHLRFTAGEERTVVEWRGVRIMLQICYDLRFPCWVRNRGDYDMILYVASWPVPRIEVWRKLLFARAIENQCYVAGVNRVGKDPACDYCGASSIIDPYGRTIAHCPDGEESSATADIDLAALEAFREKFPVLRDSDV